MKKVILITYAVISFCFMYAQKQVNGVIYIHLPNFSGQVIPNKGRQNNFELTQVSVKPNNITDEDVWFRDNQISLDYESYSFYGYKSDEPTTRNLKRFFPSNVGDLTITYCEKYDTYYAVYYSINGEGYNGVVLVALYDKSFKPIATLDFTAFMYAPQTKQGDEEYVLQTISHAHLVGNTLYIQHGHNTYAASSYNQNAYISAIDITNGRIIWTTEPLTCNSNFIIVDNSIICGYGFTAEPDYLYIVDINTGARRNRYKLAKAPALITRKGNYIYVRTYNKDYIYKLEYGN